MTLADMLRPSYTAVRRANLFLLLAALGSLLSMSADRRVDVRLRPSVVLSGGATNLWCRVTKDQRNRVLRFGILNSERELSERQLDGEASPITWGPIMFLRLPCFAGPAYCKVIRNDGSTEMATASLVVGGCEP